MENDNQLRQLIEAFIGYRDLLDPIRQNLQDFADSFQNVQSDLSRLNATFDGNVQNKLSQIMKNLQTQAEKASSLSSSIDKFVSETKNYTTALNNLTGTFERLEKSVQNITSLESSAEAQLKKLEAIAEEKKKSYNLTQLQRSLENYNSNIQSVSEYINKDVAKVMEANTKRLDDVKTSEQAIVTTVSQFGGDLKSMLQEQQATNAFLRKLVEQNGVDQNYLYDVLDAWAQSRKVKTKK